MSILETIEQGNEPEQGLKPRSELTARELLREVGAVLRMSVRRRPSSATSRSIPPRIRP